MTEADWRTTTDVPTLLRWAVPRGTRRQLRLYLCGGCRVISRHFYRPASLDAVEVVERHTDGLTSDDELSRVHWYAESPTFPFEFEEWYWQSGFKPQERATRLNTLVQHGVLPPDFVWGDEWKVDPVARDRLRTAAFLAWHVTSFGWPQHEERMRRWMDYLDVEGWPGRWLVDCIYGNPFRPLTVSPEWRTPTVLAIADGIYADRAYNRLPVLADALEDAGCDHAEVLSHCRDGGPHARGCWVLDRLLDKPDEPATATPG